jgi:hypothetical protein
MHQGLAQQDHLDPHAPPDCLEDSAETVQQMMNLVPQSVLFCLAIQLVKAQVQNALDLQVQIGCYDYLQKALVNDAVTHVHFHAKELL